MRKIGLLFAAALGIAMLSPASLRAQEDPATLERRVKAAFLYKFAGYLEWPERAFLAADSPLTIGVIGDDAMVAELAQVAAGRTIEGRPVAVRRVRDTDTLAGVHVLFIDYTERARLQQSRNASPHPILIVTEWENALAQGSVINFVVTGGRVRFEVALDNAERRSLKLSSRLLTVAQFVRMPSPP